VCGAKREEATRQGRKEKKRQTPGHTKRGKFPKERAEKGLKRQEKKGKKNHIIAKPEEKNTRKKKKHPTQLQLPDPR